MAHAIIEYSKNLESKIDLSGLIKIVHDTCIETGFFPAAGMRTRTACRENYIIGDGHVDNCFVHLLLKMGPGRSEGDKKNAMDQIFNSLFVYLEEIYDASPLALSI